MANESDNTLRLINGEGAASTEGVDSSGFVASGQSEEALLKAGKISRDEYIEMSVDRALAHLQGHIPAPRLALMREVLRSQLEEDPHLSALVQKVASAQ